MTLYAGSLTLPPIEVLSSIANTGGSEVQLDRSKDSSLAGKLNKQCTSTIEHPLGDLQRLVIRALC
jgi:hypothetical protein